MARRFSLHTYITLFLEADAYMILDTSAGPITIDVEGSLGFGDRSTVIVRGDAVKTSLYSNCVSVDNDVTVYCGQ